MALTAEKLALRLADVVATSQGEVDSADWISHDDAIEAIMDSTSLFYLRTDPATGGVLERGIWPDQDKARWNLGCFAALVEPLVAALRAQTDAIDKLVQSIPGGSEETAWAHWVARLERYEATLASIQGEARDQPSIVVWAEVTMPLLLGYFPGPFQQLGVANAGVAKSRPDVTWTATTTFQIALASSLRRQTWQLVWTDVGDRLLGIAKSIVSLPATVIKTIAEGATTAAKKVGTGVVIGTAGLILLGGVAFMATKE